MAIPDTPEYWKLQTSIEQTELALNHSKDDYAPQKLRLHVWSLADMGDYLYMLNLYSEALSYYIQAKKLDCDEPSVLNQIGVCLTFLGKIERALYYFELGYRRADNNADKALALFNCGFCHKLSSNLHEAIISLRKSMKYMPDNGTVAELEKLVDLSSKHAYRHFKQSLFSRNVLPKEEVPSKEVDYTKTREFRNN